MLPKVDYVLITSLFCAQNLMINGMNSFYAEGMVCKETVWQQMVSIFLRDKPDVFS